jgi:anaphase-promoting complex subunit 2
MLISIYGSKELFVSEYRLMLADKLLNNLDYNTDREVRNLELLKLRFGEASLHQCEIMIRWASMPSLRLRQLGGLKARLLSWIWCRDVDDSKRVNANIHSLLRSNVEMATEERPATGERAIDATIVSQHFWPPLQEEDLQVEGLWDIP